MGPSAEAGAAVVGVAPGCSVEAGCCEGTVVVSEPADEEGTDGAPVVDMAASVPPQAAANSMNDRARDRMRIRAIYPKPGAIKLNIDVVP